MTTLEITLPDDVEVEEGDVMMMIAATLYERGTLSQSQAAELAGRSRRHFIETLGDYGVSIFNYPSSELVRDVINP